MRGKQYNVTDIMAILWLTINFGQKSCGLTPKLRKKIGKGEETP
jgi:hypothetical protein